MGTERVKGIRVGGAGFDHHPFGHKALTSLYIPTYPMKKGMIVSKDDFENAMLK
jgi:hypothetical protein